MLWIERLEDAPDGLMQPLVWTTPELASTVGATAADLADAVGLGPEQGARRLARRWLLRALAARTLGVHPEAVAIVRDPAGGLRITAPEPLFVSHAGREGWTALGLARCPIGVDLESAPPLLALPLDLLHPEERARLAALPAADQPRAFARLWTVKEAYAKASGRGLDTVLAQAPTRERQGGTVEVEGAVAELRDRGEVVCAALTLG